MSNYARWLADSLAFLERMRSLAGDIRVEVQIAPPLRDEELAALQAMSRLPIPASLVRFWREASRHAQGKYWWYTPAEFQPQREVAFPQWSASHIWGGPEFSSAEEICELTQHFVSWSEGFGEQYPRDARLWLHSFPLIPVGNGDYVGLYVRDTTDDPPVVYLCHDGCGASQVIAPNLDTFLERWAEVGYIGIDFLWNFCRREQCLNPAAFPVEREATLALLAGTVRNDLVKPPRVMTAQEWSECTDPDLMIELLEERGQLDDARLRKYCCACCRRVWDRLGPWTQKALEVAERYTRGEATDAELATARTWLAGGIAGQEVERRMEIPTESILGTLLGTIGNPNGPNPLANPEFAAVTNRFMGAITDSLAFGKTQGPLHRIAYCALDAHSWISSEITQHLDDPEIAAERAAHAELIRQVFEGPV